MSQKRLSMRKIRELMRLKHELRVAAHLRIRRKGGYATEPAPMPAAHRAHAGSPPCPCGMDTVAAHRVGPQGRTAHGRVRRPPRSSTACCTTSTSTGAATSFARSMAFSGRPTPHPHEHMTWSYPAFTDGWFLGLMVSDVVSFLPRHFTERGNVHRRRCEQPGEVRSASVARALHLRFRPHG